MPRLRRLFEKALQRVRLAWLVLTTFEDIHQRSGVRISFSQDGEDLIAWSLLSHLGITRPRYLLGLGYVLAAETSVNALLVEWSYRRSEP